MYELRTAAENDYEAIYSLNKTNMKAMVAQTWGEWNEEFQKDFFDKKFTPERYRIIEVDKFFAGFIVFLEEKERVYIEEIQLAPQFQGKGVGTQILHDIITGAEKNKTPIDLQVLKINTRAIALYNRLNFILVGETDTHVLMRLV
ncbi:MAG: GNAT family N-acetyltransferase [Candidatus Magasanikbacteria bacterium]|jgi:ribosomal protein S18 acetylase RimI-like enzyme|nr:GNAT family N-acetyltransferase [Candidatus Magasanikbacteria bacterium]